MAIDQQKRKDPPQYYPICPLKKKAVPVTKCFACEFVDTSTAGKVIQLACGFPNRNGRKK